MAERRIFSSKIVCSDAFLSMPDAAQLLYFHLGMRADDDGFVNNPMQIVKSVGKRQKDLKFLIEKRFLLEVDGIVILKHWRMSNSLKNDRTKLPAYPEIAERIWIKPNKSYTDSQTDGCKTLLEYKTEYIKVSDSKRIPNGFQSDSKWIPNRTEGNRTEQNGTEGKGTEAFCASFDAFFSVYPREAEQEEAFAEWLAISPDEQMAKKIMDGLKWWLNSSQWKEENGRYIPNAAKWLRDRRWKVAFGQGRSLDKDEELAIRRMLQEDI